MCGSELSSVVVPHVLITYVVEPRWAVRYTKERTRRAAIPFRCSMRFIHGRICASASADELEHTDGDRSSRGITTHPVI
jgi:hypothetical protein